MEKLLVVFIIMTSSIRFFSCGAVVGGFLLCLYLPFTVIGF